jgi:uncharacterized protein (DUF1501 family)
MSDHEHDPIPQRIIDAASEGCEESRLLMSRRVMMGVSASLFTWAFMPRVASAAGSRDKRLLVVVLRGGMDGLSIAIPKGIHEARYRALRGRLAMETAQAPQLNSEFSLNPIMQHFFKRYTERDAAIVHAIAPPLRNRSHFACTDNLENGFGPKVVQSRSGWLNRVLQNLKEDSKVRLQGAVEIGRQPLIVTGSAPILGWSSLKTSESVPVVSRRLFDLYGNSAPRLNEMLKKGIEGDAKAKEERGDHKFVDVPGAEQHELPVRNAFRGAGRLLKRDDGPRIGVISVDNWDTHDAQSYGIARQIGTLDRALEDFRIALTENGSKTDVWRDTLVVCVSEFGRTVRVNGAGGTDHGIGTVALLLGGAVAGRKFHGTFPGLESDGLNLDRDLRATTDTRALFKGILKEHLEMDSARLALVFPDSEDVEPLKELVKT